MARPATPTTPHIRNRKARFRYEILEEFQCGINLLGTEVKSLRQGQASLDEAFARIADGEVWLRGLHIPPYEHGNAQNHDPIRPRKLLLHEHQIDKLRSKVTVKGFTLVPLELYFSKRGIVKVTLALARGKRLSDKRESLRKQDDQREMRRSLRRR